jgi:hypothetical protein
MPSRIRRPGGWWAPSERRWAAGAIAVAEHHERRGARRDARSRSRLRTRYQNTTRGVGVRTARASVGRDGHELVLMPGRGRRGPRAPSAGCRRPSSAELRAWPAITGPGRGRPWGRGATPATAGCRTPASPPGSRGWPRRGRAERRHLDRAAPPIELPTTTRPPNSPRAATTSAARWIVVGADCAVAEAGEVERDHRPLRRSARARPTGSHDTLLAPSSVHEQEGRRCERSADLPVAPRDPSGGW